MLLETLYYDVSPRQLVCFRGTFVAYRKSDPKFSSIEYAINRFFFGFARREAMVEAVSGSLCPAGHHCYEREFTFVKGLLY